MSDYEAGQWICSSFHEFRLSEQRFKQGTFIALTNGISELLSRPKQKPLMPVFLRGAARAYACVCVPFLALRSLFADVYVCARGCAGVSVCV